ETSRDIAVKYRAGNSIPLQSSPSAALYMEIGDASSGSGGRGSQALIVSRHAYDSDGRQHISKPGERLHLPAAGRARARGVLSARADQYRTWLPLAESRRLDDPRLYRSADPVGAAA